MKHLKIYFVSDLLLFSSFLTQIYGRLQKIESYSSFFPF